jgi:hypothetical protein
MQAGRPDRDDSIHIPLAALGALVENDDWEDDPRWKQGDTAVSDSEVTSEASEGSKVSEGSKASEGCKDDQPDVNMAPTREDFYELAANTSSQRGNVEHLLGLIRVTSDTLKRASPYPGSWGQEVWGACSHMESHLTRLQGQAHFKTAVCFGTQLVQRMEALADEVRDHDMLEHCKRSEVAKQQELRDLAPAMDRLQKGLQMSREWGKMRPDSDSEDPEVDNILTPKVAAPSSSSAMSSTSHASISREDLQRMLQARLQASGRSVV